MAISYPMRTFAALVAALIVLSACSGSKQKHAATPTSTAAGQATSTSQHASTSEGSSPTTPGGPSGCTTAQLKISLGPGNGAAGHIATPVVFENTSDKKCVLSGYPGVAALDRNGGQILQAVRTPRGMTGGLPPGNDTLPVVTLPHGAAASAIVETSDVTQGNAACEPSSALLVTPPGETHSVTLNVDLLLCDLQVHPVQPGA